MLTIAGWMKEALNNCNMDKLSVYAMREDFNNYLPALIKVLGEPQKKGKENVRWEIARDGFPVDVHLTDKDFSN